MKKLFYAALFGVTLSFFGCGSDNGNDAGDFDPIAIDFNAHSAALKKADSCDDYRSHLLDAAARDIADARFGWGYRWYDVDYNYADGADNAYANGEDNAGGSTDSQPKDEAGEFTVTNIQEEGVDEIDTVKNDGEWMYNIVDSQIVVTRAWPAENLDIVSRIDPRMDLSADQRGNVWPIGMLLDGDRLIVLSHTWSYASRFYSNDTLVSVYDVSDPTQPKIIKNHQLEGYLNSGRLINHRIHLVIENYVRWNMLDVEEAYYGDIPGVPSYDWDDWDDDDWESWEAKRKENIEKYLPVIRGWLEAKYPTIDTFNWPKYRSGDVERDLVSCTDLYIPATTSSKDGMLVIAELSGDDFSDVHAQAVTDSGWIVYASTDNLYVVSNSSNWYWDCYDDADSCKDVAHIHRFSLGKDNGQAKYVNSAEVPGNINDQFWMSEYDGHLRVASTENNWWGSEAGSRLSILKLEGPQMNIVGHVDNIGNGEYLYATRMFGPKGFMVTFERTDPLFTFDLSDPQNPKKMGELKINGYSSYIHKMDDNTLLTIGEDATDDGRTTGMHLQVFDVSDMTNPTRIQHVMINKDSENNSGWSSALYDHHAFNYHAASGLLSIPVNLYSWSEDDYKHFTGAFVYKVSRENGFEKLGAVNHADLLPPSCYDYSWWTSLERSRFYFKDKGVYDSGAYVYTISNHGIKVNNALNPAETIKSIAYVEYEPIVCDDPVEPKDEVDPVKPDDEIDPVKPGDEIGPVQPPVDDI